MIAGLMKGVRKKGLLVYGVIRLMMSISGLVKKQFGKNIGKKLFRSLLGKLSLADNRICICGGGPLPASTFRMFNELGIDFVQGYGLTETSPITHLNPIYHFVLTSVGRSFPLEDVKIIEPDEDGNGTICIKGPNVMLVLKVEMAEDPLIPPFGSAIDYLVFGGIYRPVSFFVRPVSHLGLFAVSSLDGKTVSVRLEANGEGLVQLRLKDGGILLAQQVVTLENGKATANMDRGDQLRQRQFVLRQAVGGNVLSCTRQLSSCF